MSSIAVQATESTTEYTMTTSTQNSGLFFEKKNTENNEIASFTLIQEETDNGIRYIFEPKVNEPVTPPTGEATYINLGKNSASDFSNAESKCANLHQEGKNWRILNESDLENLVSSQDMEIANVLAPEGYGMIWQKTSQRDPIHTQYTATAAQIAIDDGSSFRYQPIYSEMGAITSTVCISE